MPQTDQLAAQLDRLAQFEAGPFPVVSLYLNLQPNQHGRDQFDQFIRKELSARVATYEASGPEHESLERDAERIRARVSEIEPSANGLAVFACSGADLFEAIALAAPIDEHRLYISDAPHVYPLARLIDEYPRYAVLLADTHTARIFVFASNTLQRAEHVEGTKTRRHKMGGWSQARYQRHIENYHQQHVRDVVDTLARIVRDEGIESIVIAGDEVVMPLIREELPKDLASKVVDTLQLDIRAPEHEVLTATIEAMRGKDAESDRERVDEMLGAYRAGGLATVGIEGVRAALELSQVDELLITATPATIKAQGTGAEAGERTPQERIADELIAKARQTAAGIRFIQDPALLQGVGGVGATLRFRI